MTPEPTRKENSQEFSFFGILPPTKSLANKRITRRASFSDGVRLNPVSLLKDTPDGNAIFCILTRSAGEAVFQYYLQDSEIFCNFNLLIARSLRL